MKKALFVLGILLVLGLAVAGCSKQVVEDTTGGTENTEPPTGPADHTGTPEEYIDDQIIDETSELEIGEMI
ncbi:MAG: hypothetical protein ACP5N3_02695 [Candidatus Nanoarchaeia archaeon]